MLVCFHDIADPLMPIHARILFPKLRHHVRDGQKRAALEQNYLFRTNALRKRFQEFFNDNQVRYHLMHYPGPGFVQCLIPNTTREHFDFHVFRPGLDHATALVVDALPVLVLDEIHFVHKTEDEGGGAKFFQGFDNGTVGIEIAFDFAGFDVENVDEDCHIGEDGLALGSEVRLGESILSNVELACIVGCLGVCLPAAVPEVEREIPHELSMTMLDVDSCA